MKILALRFANVNCLAGEWKIDFRDPAFGEGLFVLAGDTGAGKSSILDAVTLALYGRTARQAKVTESTDEAMNRDADSCFAEVEFLGADGGAWRSRWSQDRVRHRDGTTDFRAAKMSLVRLSDGADVSAHRLDDTKKLVAEKAGFSFDDFTRTVLLEQGEFDKFLHAADKDRADILERATNTAHFAAVGARINERAKAEGRELIRRKADETTAAERAAGARDPAEVEAGRAAAESRASSAAARADALRAEKAWLDEEAALAAGARDLASAAAALEARRADRDAAVAALALADRARALLPAWERVRAARLASEEAGRLATAARERASRAADESAAAEKLRAEASAALAAARDAGPALEPLRAASAEADRASRAAEAARADTERKWTESVRPALDARLASLEEKRLLAVKVKSLERHRRELVPGRPCPLCGSLSHPYAEGLPTPDDVQGEIDAVRRERAAAEEEVSVRARAARDAARAAETARGAADAEERRLRAAAEAAAERAAGAAAAVAAAVAAAEAARDALASATDAVRRTAADADAARLAFDREREEAGFATHDDWRAAGLSAARHAALRAGVDAFTRDEAALGGRREALDARRAAHEAARPAAPRGAGAVEADLAAAEAERDEATRLAERLRGELAAQAADRDALARAQAARAAQEETCRKWNLLDRALGGPGGANFRLYAQGRNLCNLLEAGSEHLSEMSGGRYRFEWNPAAGTLEPLVRDRHFGAPRPVSNLSGGESFLASLALALAFARFDAARRPVGTLFLDEGFGTLDEAALDKALDVLAGLRDAGRQVGLVTHVAQVKERVPVRIDVTKLGDGRSALSGAGVTAGPSL